MSQLNLDPHPLNELGRGILAPDVEARLLADGYIFAATVIPKDRRVPPFLATSKRPFAEAAASFFRHADEVLRAQRREPPGCQRRASGNPLGAAPAAELVPA